MSFNSKQLKASPDAKSPKKPKDVIIDPMGQWKYPGEITKIPSGDITMAGVPYPVLGIDNLGNQQMMMPGQNYKFPGNTVTEYPQISKAKTGGWLDEYESENTNLKHGGGVGLKLKSGLHRGKTHKNIQSSINELFLRNEMIYGPSGRNIYSPLPHAQNGLSTSVNIPGPKQFLTPEQREIVARQHGMDQGEIKPYDDSFANNLYQFANKIDRGGLNPIAGLITDPMKSAANLMKPKEHLENYGPVLGSAMYAANVFDIFPETKLSKFGSKELKDRIMKQRVIEGFEKVPVPGAFNTGVWMSKKQPDFVIKDVPFEHTIDEFYKPEYRNPEKFLEDYRKAFSKVPPSTGYSKVLQLSDPTPGVPIRDLVLSELQTRQTGKNYADYFKNYLPSEGVPINLLQFDKQNQLVEKMLPELRKFRDVGNYLKDEGLTWENAGSNIIYDDVRNKLSAIDLIPTSMMKPRSDTGLENLLPRLFYKTKTIGPKDFTDQIIQGNLTEKKANELMDNYKRVIEKAGIKLGRDPYDMDKGLGRYFPTRFVKEGDKFQTGGSLPKAQTGIQTQTQQQPKPIYQFSKEDQERLAKQKQANDFNAQQSKYIQQPGTVYNTDDNSWLSNMYNEYEQMNTNADGNRNHISELFTYLPQAGLRLAGTLAGQHSYGQFTDPMSWVNTGMDLAAVTPMVGILGEAGSQTINAVKPHIKATKIVANNIKRGFNTPTLSEKFQPVTKTLALNDFTNLKDIQRLSSLSMERDLPREKLIKNYLNSSLDNPKLMKLTGKTRGELEAELEHMTTSVKKSGSIQLPNGVTAHHMDEFSQLNPAEREGFLETLDVDFPNHSNIDEIRDFFTQRHNILTPESQRIHDSNLRNNFNGVDYDLENSYRNHLRERFTNPLVEPDLSTWLTHHINITRPEGYRTSRIINQLTPAQEKINRIIVNNNGFKTGQKWRSWFKPSPNLDEFVTLSDTYSNNSFLPSLSKHYGQSNKDIMSQILAAKSKFKEAGPGIYDASISLSDNSAPMYYNIASKLQDTPNIKYHVRGFQPLNNMGFLKNAGIKEEQILDFINTDISKLKFQGKKLPAAYMEGNNIMIPDLLMEKYKFGGQSDKWLDNL